MIDRLAYTMSEAAEALGVSLWVIKKELYEGRIVGVKFGTRVVIPRWSLEQRLRYPGDRRDSGRCAEGGRNLEEGHGPGYAHLRPR